MTKNTIKTIAKAIAAIESVVASCGKSHNQEADQCCSNCSKGLPCDGCEQDSEESIDDPYDYLAALEEQYEDMGIQRANSAVGDILLALSGAKDVTLEAYLDRRAALYQLGGLKRGVKYIDKVDTQREDLEETEDQLSAANAAVSKAAEAIKESSSDSLIDVLMAVSQAAIHSERGNQEKADNALDLALERAKRIVAVANESKRR